MQASKKAGNQNEETFTYLCLDEECTEKVVVSEKCLKNKTHKHSKTSIVKIQQIKQQLKDAWELEENPCTAYKEKITKFYQKLRKEVNDMLKEDEKLMKEYLERISYYHLPKSAHSETYIRLIKGQYDGLAKHFVIGLINEAENGTLNKDHSQKQILSFFDAELAKINDKIRSIKYILPAKKIHTELLIPPADIKSLIANQAHFTKVYSLFNSKGMLIRSSSLVWRASETNFSQKQFYNRCNNVCNCLVLASLNNDRIVGGFSPISLVHHEEDELNGEDIVFENDPTGRSFIFSLTNFQSFELRNPSKAIGYRKGSKGPIFGVDLDLSKEEAESSIGYSYKCLEGIPCDSLQAKLFLLGAQKIKIKELEVWELSF